MNLYNGLLQIIEALDESKASLISLVALQRKLEVDK